MHLEDMIRMRAYDIWIAEGCPKGREKDHWAQAAAEIEASIADAPENTGISPDAETPATAEEEPPSKPTLVRRAA